MMFDMPLKIGSEEKCFWMIKMSRLIREYTQCHFSSFFGSVHGQG